MKILIPNPATHKLEELTTIKPMRLTMYTCGPTVYDRIHLGNARTLMIFDVIRRYLMWIGYKMTYLQNFTDIDNKIIARAEQQGVRPGQLAEAEIINYFKDSKAIGIRFADEHPRVTYVIPELIKDIEQLIHKGHAYVTDTGVYFDVQSHKTYGQVHNCGHAVLSELLPDGHDSRNFALWKRTETGPNWHSPWGYGRPGWHIECSTMIKHYCGETIDIHAGGMDLRFPHHTNEVAQSESLTGKPLAKHWLHSNMVIFPSGAKMSKSLAAGPIKVHEILEAGASMESIRAFLIFGAAYRSTLTYTFEDLRAAGEGFEKLELRGGPVDNLTAFYDHLNRNFNFPAAYGWVVANNKKGFTSEAAGELRGIFHEVFGLRLP